MKPLTLIFFLSLSFVSGYAIGCDNQVLEAAKQAVQEVTPTPINQSADLSKLSYDSELKDNRSVTIVFTVDDFNKIHVLHVSGGINLVTQYIKNSLEGKEVHSENAIPGINYLMTIKLPASV